MQAERWKQIEDLCHAALELAPEKRAAFLAQACPDDPQLRAEVQSLLDQQADSFLESSPVSAVRALSAGAKLGNFEIVELLGRGGMGEVWRARDTRLKRDVAIKVLPAALARDPDRIARFEREARAASALNHPNIVSVYDIGCDNGTYWIASELVRGDTLRRAIEAGPLPAPKVIEIAVQVAAALATAHATGLVHRDLKPDNIMVTRSGQVKILDFGLAKQQRSSPDSTTADLTDEGVVLGTAGYMSPEQVRGDAADHRSDLFSFGVVLYEMLCGKRAFAGDSSVEVMHAILKDEPPELPASVPPALGRIVRRCLEKEPDRRFQSAADLGFALEALSLAPARAESPKRRAWWKWVGLVGAAVALGGVYLLTLRSPRPSAPPETQLRRLTNDAGLVMDAAISPDGKLVAYSSNRENSANRHIWLRQVDGDGLIRLTNDPADDSDPAFSPDGTEIAFRSEREGGGIYVVPVLGGEARELVPEGRRPSFSPAGRWLMYQTRRGGLFVRPISGGQAVQLGGATHLPCNAVWSPDGSRILFQADCDLTVRPTWVSTVDGEDLKRNRELDPVISSGEVTMENGLLDQWIPNPSRLLIRKRVADAFAVTAVPVSADGTKVTGAPQRLTSVTDQLLHVSAALDGRIVLSASTAKTHIWGLPIDAKGNAAGEPKRITYGSEDEAGPTLSRDGRRMTFASKRANILRLFYKDLTTGRETELSTDRSNYRGSVFKADGTGIMCVHGDGGFLEYIPLSGGPPKKIWDRLALPWDWSPDGKTLLFLTGGVNGKPRWGVVRQLDLDSLLAAAFLDDPDFDTWCANFSHDGRWVTFNATPRDLKSSRIYVVPFRKTPLLRSEWIPITHGDWDDKPRFSSDDKSIFFVSGSRDGSRRFWAQKVTADMRPNGNLAALYSSGDSQRVITDDGISVGPRLIVFTQADLTGNIYVLEPAKRDAH
jgi:serine/threonine protein kinase/Tol biopolymer transport system component